MHAEAVPSREKRCPKDTKDEDGEGALEHPYNSRPADIQVLHAQYRYEIIKASSPVVDLELGKRNVEEFVNRYKDDDNYIFIKMFSKPVSSETNHDGYIVTDADGKVKKLLLFVYHPEGSMHCERMVFASSNAIWSSMAAFGRFRPRRITFTAWSSTISSPRSTKTTAASTPAPPLMTHVPNDREVYEELYCTPHAANVRRNLDEAAYQHDLADEVFHSKLGQQIE